MTDALFLAEDFSLAFDAKDERKIVLHSISLAIAPGEVVGLVGESGSGKSVTAMAAMGLLPPGVFVRTGGRLALFGRDVADYPESEFEDLRGKRVAMVFQEPMSALNPVRRVGDQFGAALRRHADIGRSAASERGRALLARMRVADPARILASYPHELSGGLRQRALIAMAMAHDIDLLIMDEPTTALDVTVQAEVIALVRELARERGTAILFITHDLALVRQLCERVYVMYRGAIVEEGATATVLAAPAHDYTRTLLASLPGNAPPKTRLSTEPAL